MNSKLLLLLLALSCVDVMGQVSAKLMRFPDVSETHITFTYGNDIWVVEKSGGVAHRLSSPAGLESFPRFSPDGQTIAFSGNYGGNTDVYSIPVSGGAPKRLTYHGMSDRVLDWTVDGSAVLFASSKESGKQRFAQFYTVDKNGGYPEKLPVAYGAGASYSPDGTQLAFTDRSRVARTWKRYEGGDAADIQIFNLATYASENITNNKANDEIPMWGDGAIYFISDRGPEKRYNLHKYDLASRQTTQLTEFKDFDIHYPSIGPKEIVFQAGEDLYLFNLTSEDVFKVNVSVVMDQVNLMPTRKKVADYLQSATVSPDGNRVVAQARGELFDLPAKEGFIQNLTKSSGVAERYPAWSPDGKKLAYWTDQPGEYQLAVRDMESGKVDILSSFTNGFRYNIYWSPDSKKIAYVNQAMEMQCFNVETKQIDQIGKGQYMFEGPLQSFSVTWSKDSRYVAYSDNLTRVNTALFVYDLQSKTRTQLTSGFYSDASPAFSPDGKYLFYTTNRHLDPDYSDLDNTFIYANTTQLAVATLAKSTPSILAARNDTMEEEEEPAEEEEPKGKSKKKKSAKEEPEEESVVFEYDGFEQRTEIIEGAAGNLANLTAVEGKLVYVHYPNTGAEGSPALKYYDIEERKHEEIIDGVADYEVTANGEKMLIVKEDKLAVIGISSGASAEDFVPTGEMAMDLIPMEEWQQIYRDVWRLERDYFYDDQMHGVDWEAVGKRYGDLVKSAGSREDVNFLIGELIGELNASHTYRGGGDIEEASRLNVGYLGANYIVENGRYKISEIVRGAPWDIEAVSPLLQSGVDVKEGDYILAVNGVEVDGSKSIHAWFQGMADKVVQLKVNSTPNMTGAREIIVKPMRSETRLRHLAWAESNRQKVLQASNGRVGYVFVPSTGVDGQTELIRQYYGQIDKEGMVIDERFNNGGQIPDRFIEILNRKPLAFWAVRDGEDWEWPPVANFGPKAMLINGFAGSGGDAFPDYFRKAGLGPLVGMRTWGGLIGISGAPGLIDNGYVTVPTFRMYNPDGTWFSEGHGVEPDIEVPQDFEQLSQGTDVQLNRAVEEVMKQLNSGRAFKKPDRPAKEVR